MGLQETLIKIEELYNQLKKLPMKQEDEKRLWQKFRLEWNYNSNHIEGNTLTYGETQLLLIFEKTTGDHDAREYDEMRSHDVAIKMIDELAHDNEHPLTEAFIKQLNKIILVKPFLADAKTPEGKPTQRLIDIGDYKKFPNHVELKSGEMFYYATPEETPAKMGDLIQWYKNALINNLSPLLLAAELHYRFVRIHPFDDGNGRIARLLMNYVLMKHDLPPVIIKSKDKRNYLTALNKADTGDIESFYEYAANELVWSLNKSIDAANGKSIEDEDDLEKEISVWKKQLQNVPIEVLPKSDKQIYELYQNSFKNLFELFLEKTKQFDDLFASKEVWAFINNKNSEHGGIENIYSAFKIWNRNETTPGLKGMKIPQTIEPFDNLMIRIQFKGFKKDGINVFDQQAELRIEFMPFLYMISINGEKKIENHYSVFITEEGAKNIVSDAVKKTFAQIKSKVKNQ